MKTPLTDEKELKMFTKDVSNQLNNCLNKSFVNNKKMTRRDLAKRTGKAEPFITAALSGEKNLTLASIGTLTSAMDHVPFFTTLPKNGSVAAMHYGKMGTTSAKKATELSHDELLREARDFVASIFSEFQINVLVENEPLVSIVKEGDQKQNINYPISASVECLFDPDLDTVHISYGKREGENVGPDFMQIVKRATFLNGFSENEWFLETHDELIFRSLDLGQVAMVAATIISRGGLFN